MSGNFVSLAVACSPKPNRYCNNENRYFQLQNSINFKVYSVLFRLFNPNSQRLKNIFVIKRNIWCHFQMVVRNQLEGWLTVELEITFCFYTILPLYRLQIHPLHHAMLQSYQCFEAVFGKLRRLFSSQLATVAFYMEQPNQHLLQLL